MVTTREIVKEFAESTTAHGVSRIFSSKSVWGRIFWSACFLGAFGLFCWQLSRLIERYIAKPVTVDIRVDVKELTFPAVTLCNLNQFRKSQIANGTALAEAIDNFAQALENQMYSGPGPTVTNSTQSNTTGSSSGSSRKKREVNVDVNEDFEDGSAFNEIAETDNIEINNDKNQITEDLVEPDLAALGLADFYENIQVDAEPEAASHGVGPEARDQSEAHRRKKRSGPDPTVSWSAPVWTTNLSDGSGSLTTVDPQETSDVGSGSGSDTSSDSHSSSQSGTFSSSYSSSSGDYSSSPSYSSYYYSSSSYQNPDDDYYDPEVNLTGRDWFNDYSDSALVASQKNLTVLVSQMDITYRRNFGHQILDFVQGCSFNGKKCSPKNFTAFNHRRYGNCFTFNSGIKKDSILKSSKPGPLYGFSATLYIQQHEYIKALSPAAGVRVLIHRQDMQPFPEEDGFDISPGQKTSVSLRVSRFHRLPYPYSNCTDGTGRVIMYNKNYSVAACLRTCYQKHKIDECKCGDPALPITTGTAVCNDTDQINCLKDVETLFEEGRKACDCPQVCSDFVYVQSISTSDWPAKTFEETLRKQYSLRDKTLGQALEKYGVKENLVKVEVYFHDLTYQELKELPAYGVENLLGDIGGQLGLWIGVSIITIIEVLELGARLCKHVVVGRASVGTQTNMGDEEYGMPPVYQTGAKIGNYKKGYERNLTPVE